MAERGFQPVFSAEAAEFLIQLPKRRRKKVLLLVSQLANRPYVRSDYSIRDESNRAIEHLRIDQFVFAYWLDHAVRELRIVDIEDAS